MLVEKSRYMVTSGIQSKCHSTEGYFASTVGQHGDEGKIGKYVKNQGNEYQQLHSDTQQRLF
jgi:hypothetical protein